PRFSFTVCSQFPMSTPFPYTTLFRSLSESIHLHRIIRTRVHNVGDHFEGRGAVVAVVGRVACLLVGGFRNRYRGRVENTPGDELQRGGTGESGVVNSDRARGGRVVERDDERVGVLTSRATRMSRTSHGHTLNSVESLESLGGSNLGAFDAAGVRRVRDRFRRIPIHRQSERTRRSLNR